jgi:hypothetical protein
MALEELLMLIYIVDVDECSLYGNVCPYNGVCVNTPGSYNCNCNPGTELRGRSCVGTYSLPGSYNCNPCTELRGRSCVDTYSSPGSYNCNPCTELRGRSYVGTYTHLVVIIVILVQIWCRYI